VGKKAWGEKSLLPPEGDGATNHTGAWYKGTIKRFSATGENEVVLYSNGSMPWSSGQYVPPCCTHRVRATDIWEVRMLTWVMMNHVICRACQMKVGGSTYISAECRVRDVRGRPSRVMVCLPNTWKRPERDSAKEVEERVTLRNSRPLGEVTNSWK